MSPEEIRNQCEDDADRAPSDLTVWRDRGAIIAAQQTRIAQLEAQVASLGLRDDVGYGVIIEGTGILMSTYDGTAKKHTRKIGHTPWVEVSE